MKKINKIIQQVQSAYKKCSNVFYSYFDSKFIESIDTNSFSDKNFQYAINYDHEAFHKFIDNCVYYRLGITDTQPLKKDITYNLSNSVSPSFYERTIDDVFQELIYHAYPAKITQPLNEMLIAYKINEQARELIMSKIECSTS